MRVSADMTVCATICRTFTQGRIFTRLRFSKRISLVVTDSQHFRHQKNPPSLLFLLLPIFFSRKHPASTCQWSGRPCIHVCPCVCVSVAVCVDMSVYVSVRACVYRATVIERGNMWFRDDGALTRVFCQDSK